MRLLVLLPVLLAGCNLKGFEAEIQGRTPFAPPAVYLQWWHDTSTCANLSGSFEELAFYLADWITGNRLVARARWSEPHDIIIVRGYEADSKVVRHGTDCGPRGHEAWRTLAQGIPTLVAGVVA